MAVDIRESPLDARLTKAQEMTARGKVRQALDQLWAAEALARGDADSLRRTSDVAAALREPFGSGHTSQLAQLIEVLRHDIAVASGATASRAGFAVPLTLGAVAKGLGTAILWAMGGGLAGVIIGAIVGRLTENPNEILASLDPVFGAMVGFPIGALVGLVLWGIWASPRTPTQPPQP